jgi:hypothetical protein
LSTSPGWLAPCRVAGRAGEPVSPAVRASLAELMGRAELLDKLSEAGRVACTRRRYSLHLAGANGRDLATRPGRIGRRARLALSLAGLASRLGLGLRSDRRRVCLLSLLDGRRLHLGARRCVPLARPARLRRTLNRWSVARLKPDEAASWNLTHPAAPPPDSHDLSIPLQPFECNASECWEGERLDLGLVEETRRRNKSPQESRSDES